MVETEWNIILNVHLSANINLITSQYCFFFSMINLDITKRKMKEGSTSHHIYAYKYEHENQSYFISVCVCVCVYVH